MELLHALYVEINAIGICLLLIILYKQRQDVGSSTLQRQFNYLLYATIIMLVVDTACWVLDGATFPGARTLKITSETIYYLFNGIIPFFWVIYVEFAIGRDRNKTFRKIKLLSIPLLLLIALIIANLFTGVIFTLDENNVYHRNYGFYAFVVEAYTYLLYATIRALRAARRASWMEDKRRYYALAFFIVPPGIAGIFQTFVYGLSLIWIFVVITIMLMYIDSLNRLISADPLTGINNRRELTKFIQRETRDPSYSGLLALIMMDVDNFKQINDDYGHYYGDETLVQVADILKDSCKNTTAFLARYGGDEFCIVYPATTRRVVEEMIANILRNVIRWNTKMKGQTNIGLSIGYSVWEPNDTVDAFYQRADRKMYLVKAEKKKRD